MTRRFWRAVVLAAVTPLLEKNVAKTLSLDVPVVFSMTRVIVLAFAVVMLRAIWRAGAGDWPTATLSMAIVLAMPVLSAIERGKPGQVLELARTLIGRFGVGAVRPIPVDYTREPSKYDDHRGDS